MFFGRYLQDLMLFFGTTVNRHVVARWLWKFFFKQKHLFIEKRGVAARWSFGDLWEKQIADFGNKNQKVRSGTVVLDDF